VLFCEFAQAAWTETVAAIDRHRQAERLVGTPAGSRQAAIEFSAASGAGEAARGLIFQTICHQRGRILTRN
jgi:hypothetical protein